MSGWWIFKDFQECLTGMKSLLGYGSVIFGTVIGQDMS